MPLTHVILIYNPSDQMIRLDSSLFGIWFKGSIVINSANHIVQECKLTYKLGGSSFVGLPAYMSYGLAPSAFQFQPELFAILSIDPQHGPRSAPTGRCTPVQADRAATPGLNSPHNEYL